ncbi:helix-turn-helix domain-containing protein [Embleya sp. AB8]|uniref:helix-turn-helix domain-containing protein n=1 Tax=Embleya sp. AB8 TaxID=3156304 RepID=UPI003C76F10E
MTDDIEPATPALCRLQLGAELRRLRRRAELKSSQVAKRLLWSPSKLTRLEQGDNVVVEPDDTTSLCDLYGADPETRSLLNDYATVTKSKQDEWRSPRAQPAIGPTLHAFIGLEAAATTRRAYASECVPGLLQTQAYTREIHRVSPIRLGSDEIDLHVATRMARQEALHRADEPPQLLFILNESVLRRRVGDPAVAREQLEHIADISTLHNVRVQVVPFTVRFHVGMICSFDILRFAKAAASRPIVHLETMASAWVVGRESAVDAYERAFQDLQALAPSPEETRDLIHRAIKEL